MNNKEKGKLIRYHILRDVVDHPQDITKHIAEIYSITPQAVYNHLARLEQAGLLASSGRGKGKKYFLGDKRSAFNSYSLNNNLSEDEIWRKDFLFMFDNIAENIVDICHYGFTEMVNNVIDHSDASELKLSMFREKEQIKIRVIDNGIGIFRKIKNYYHLADEREAIFELSKGKLTTDPQNHTGEGIFFTSRVFDWFFVDSMDLTFSHEDSQEFDLFFNTKISDDEVGTSVCMVINRNSGRILQDVFDDFAGPDEYQFNKTVLALELALYDQEKLVSRSQAKRVLNRVDKFTTVALDFEGIDSIGQAFSDEIFRVFTRNNPEITLVPINMTEQVEKMVKRAQHHE